MVEKFRRLGRKCQRRRFRPLVAALCGLALFCAAAAHAADVPDLYTVRNVPVDATDTTATAAREAARLQGEQDALRILFQRLTLPADAARLPTPPPAAVADAILSFEVVRERSSSVRYVGEMTYRFKPAAVRRFLRDAGVVFSETTSRPAVILPVLIAPDGPQVWTDNPWKAAWTRSAAAGGTTLVPVTVPQGDARDTAVATPADLAQVPPLLSPAQAGDLSARYGGGDVVVATLKTDGTEVAVTRISASDATPAAPRTVTIGPAPADTPDMDLYGRAVLAVRRDLDQSWKRTSGAAPAATGSLQLDIPINGLADWVGLRDRLLKVSSIAQLDVTYLDQTDARATLAYRGDTQALKTVLAQQNLNLEEGTPLWTLRRQDAPAATPPAASP